MECTSPDAADRELEDRLAAEQVASLAVDGHHDGHRQ